MENHVSSAGVPSEVFEYKFRDYVFKGYPGQDNVQAASATGHIVREVKERRSEVREIVFQSDSAL